MFAESSKGIIEASPTDTEWRVGVACVVAKLKTGYEHYDAPKCYQKVFGYLFLSLQSKIA